MRRLALLALLLGCSTPATSDREEDPANGDFLGESKEDSVNFVEEGSYDGEAVLRLVNSADFLQLFDEVGLSQATSTTIADATKPIVSLAELDGLPHVGLIAFAKLKDFALENEYGPGLGEEYPPAGEAVATQSVVDIIKNHVTGAYPAGTRPVRRPQHAKAHGCVKAFVDIETDELPATLRRGLFAEETEYMAWVRFSNGDFAVKPDGDADVRGMAIKIMGVEGTRVTEDAAGTTQDILLINGPTLFVRNALEYGDFTRRAAQGGSLTILGYFFSLNPADWKIRGLKDLMAIFAKKVRNPLESQYFSTTPYALGGTAVKWSARPCGGAYAAPDGGSSEALRAALRASLEGGDACFELLVQMQTDPRAQPIEDPTFEWKTPMVHVGKIRLPRQTFDTAEQNAFCERQVFTPWHSLEEHRPLGGINRARLTVYAAMSRLRNMMNGATASEPTSFEIK